jgi:SAM-dependent methyltransferase
MLVSGAEDEAKRVQAAYFDERVDAEYEITRPRGAPAFHAWLLAEKFRRSVFGVESLVSGSTVLSVCAGSGLDAEYLAGLGAQVVAADLSVEASLRTSERARRFGLPIDAVVADAERLPFADRSFEVVYVHDGLHHLERPEVALAEMARVARRAVCITEPADAALTRLAMRVGVAQEVEAAGNRVARLRLEDVIDALERRGFRIIHAERYAMFYRHYPGRTSYLLSHPVLFPLAKQALRAANAVLRRAGNKLVVVAVRP